MEEWKPVVGHEESYEVSDLGRVRSLDREVPCFNGTRRMKGRILKPGPNNSGHVTVAIGQRNSRLVHTLVLEAFVGPRPEGCDSLHLNHNPKDNRLSNLKWGTRGENVKADFDRGARKTSPNFNRWGYRYV